MSGSKSGAACSSSSIRRNGAAQKNARQYPATRQRLTPWPGLRAATQESGAGSQQHSATTRDVQLAGGWKNPGMVARYAARVGAGAVGRFMREPAGGKPDS